LEYSLLFHRSVKCEKADNQQVISFTAPSTHQTTNKIQNSKSILGCNANLVLVVAFPPQYYGRCNDYTTMIQFSGASYCALHNLQANKMAYDVTGATVSVIM
jgi:hypothetical protein